MPSTQHPGPQHEVSACWQVRPQTPQRPRGGRRRCKPEHSKGRPGGRRWPLSGLHLVQTTGPGKKQRTGLAGGSGGQTSLLAGCVAFFNQVAHLLREPVPTAARPCKAPESCPFQRRPQKEWGRGRFQHRANSPGGRLCVSRGHQEVPGAADGAVAFLPWRSGSQPLRPGLGASSS